MGDENRLTICLSEAGIEQLKKRLMKPEEDMPKAQINKIKCLRDNLYHQSSACSHLFTICIKIEITFCPDNIMEEL